MYNTDGEATSGIREWKAELANAVPIVAQTELSAGWYVVNADVTILSRITCSGDVHLILADGFTLTASAGITVVDGTATLTIYGQDAGTGTLVAQGGSQGAGIGGFSTGTDSTCVNGGAITIDGGTVTATGGNYGAGIGGGKNAKGNNITINGGTITASSGTAKAWGIGYGYTTSTSWSYGMCIYADTYVTVEARSKTTGSWKEITHASESVDLSNNSSFRVRYVQTTPPAQHAVALAPCEYGTVSINTAKAAPCETVTLALTIEEAGALLAVKAYKTGDETTEVALTTVTEGERYSFTMPDYDVTVQADFKTPTPTEPMASAPTEVANATFKVFTNGVLSADGIV